MHEEISESLMNRKLLMYSKIKKEGKEKEFWGAKNFLDLQKGK